VVFPRRAITRPPSSSEDNDGVSDEAFNRSVADGEFALWWEAHSHRYGIPSSINDHIGSDRTVVCNVSRTVVGFARRKYSAVHVVLVTAPPKVLAGRLVDRNRGSDGAVADRLARAAALGTAADADVVIHNVGAPELGIRRLLNVVRDTGYFVIS
jgi:ribose 1,5-bisphosphokinase